MLELRHLKVSDYQVQRWKNGLGETRQIAAGKEDPFHWRLSWATLNASGPFSRFEGYDRTLVLLRGKPIRLIHSSKESELKALTPYSFDGGLTTQAILSAPTEDFNVFALREKARAGVYVAPYAQDEEVRFPLAGQEHFLFNLGNKLEVLEQNSGEKLFLETHETFQLRRSSKKEYLNLRTKPANSWGLVIWVVIHCATPSS